MKITKDLEIIINTIISKGGIPYLVGGCVRDYFLKIPIKDYDIEVYGLELFELQQILKKFGTVKEVGKNFGILLFNSKELGDIDFSLPRTENKTDKGHKGFEVKLNKNLSTFRASKRRDITINSIMYNLKENMFIDNHNGMIDIFNKKIKHIDNKTFMEDPLRVLRIAQFISRFKFECDDKTKELCKTIIKCGHLDDLPKERVFEEFNKLLLKGKKPSLGLIFLKEIGYLKKYFPELDKLDTIKQDPKYHPEGNVWNHTLKIVDYINDNNKTLSLMYACLFHDVGKGIVLPEIDEKGIHHKCHEGEGAKVVPELMERLTNNQELIENVMKLVKKHMILYQYRKNLKRKYIKRLMLKVNIMELVYLYEADKLSRKDYPKKDYDDMTNFMFAIIKYVTEIKENNELEPIFKGRHLIEMGYNPTSWFGAFLKIMMEEQINGSFTELEEAKLLATKLVGKFIEDFKLEEN